MKWIGLGRAKTRRNLDFFASLTPRPTTSGAFLRALSSPKRAAPEPLSPTHVSKVPRIANQPV